MTDIWSEFAGWLPVTLAGLAGFLMGLGAKRGWDDGGREGASPRGASVSETGEVHSGTLLYSTLGFSSTTNNSLGKLFLSPARLGHYWTCVGSSCLVCHRAAWGYRLGSAMRSRRLTLERLAGMRGRDS